MHGYKVLENIHYNLKRNDVKMGCYPAFVHWFLFHSFFVKNRVDIVYNLRQETDKISNRDNIKTRDPKLPNAKTRDPVPSDPGFRVPGFSSSLRSHMLKSFSSLFYSITTKIDTIFL